MTAGVIAFFALLILAVCGFTYVVYRMIRGAIAAGRTQNKYFEELRHRHKDNDRGGRTPRR